MATKKRGRKSLPKKEKKVVVYTMVKLKDKSLAQVDIDEIGRKYNTPIEGNQYQQLRIGALRSWGFQGSNVR